MNTNNITLGLIGAGRIGKVHAQNLAHRVIGADLVAVSDVVPQAAQACAAQYNIPQVKADYRSILDDKAIMAVLICSNTDTHAQIIEEAAQAGKHIFCEKPIALDLGKIDQALAAVAENRVKLQIGFNRRFDPNFKYIRAEVLGGKIGQPHIVRITSRDPSPPPLDYVKVSGGLFLDMTIHDFDMARYLINSEVEEVYAMGAVLVDPAIGQAGDIDTSLITLRYANGAIGTIDNSRQAVYGYDQRVEVFGQKGNLSAANEVPHRVSLSNAEGVHEALPHHFFLERYNEAYIAEMLAFIKIIQQDLEPPVTGLDGRVPVVMGLAALRSFQENRPVKINEVGNA